MLTRKASFLGLISVFLTSLVLGRESIPNWPAPAFWQAAAGTDAVSSPPRTVRREGALATPISPFPFIEMTPCRIVDTRGPVGTFGGPSLPASTPRNFALPAGPCAGIPASVSAYSLNITVTNTLGPGFISIYPQGASAPLVSTLNYVANQTVANAAIVPAGTGGGVTVVAGVSGTDLIVDINGVYAGAAVGIINTFLGLNAGGSTTTGDFNTAMGFGALGSNMSGSSNVAIGSQALLFNTSGGANTAIGDGALPDNVTGNSNTAIGSRALDLSKGSNNIGIGAFAGGLQQTGSHDIYIGNAGVNGESNTIRIGDVSFQDGGTIITGISGLSSIGGSPVYVNGGGRLGTSTSSSRRFKQAIRDIAEESDGLMTLRPVAFNYKPEIDPTGLTQYGLIAEEVAEVFPDLVTSDRAGQPEGVRYHLITPLLLNEVQKQRRTIESQQAEIEQQNETIAGLAARLARLEARLAVERQP